jgi:signal peptidase I
MKAYIKEFGITLALAVVIYLLIRLVVQSSEVFDISMQPTLVDGQRLIVLKVLYEPQRGDIIVVYPPGETGKQYVKRLIGLPGDTVEVRDEKLYLNGVALEEPYIKAAPTYTMASRTLNADEYFVLGDNRNNSSDSHYGWTVTRDAIVGKAWLRFWPLSVFGGPGNYPLSEQLEVAGADTSVLPQSAN